MIFDFLFKKKQRSAPNEVPKQEQAEQPKPKEKETLEDRIDREMMSMPFFIKNQIKKDPSVKQKFIDIAKRMEKDGVDMNSPRAMKKWIKEHEEQLKEENAPGVKVETVIKNDEPGRNDPCPCGSGKKYKKCCGK
jgi:uncharacterized protein YecA (UPF0149 family)